MIGEIEAYEILSFLVVGVVVSEIVRMNTSCHLIPTRWHISENGLTQEKSRKNYGSEATQYTRKRDIPNMRGLSCVFALSFSIYFPCVRFHDTAEFKGAR